MKGGLILETMDAMQKNAPAFGLQRKVALLMAVLVPLFVAGCQLPRTGPMLYEMTSANDARDVVVVAVTPEHVRASRMPAVEDFPKHYRDLTHAGFDRLVPGDGINVTVWERDGLGVFAADATGASNLGNHEIDAQGNLYVPILGNFRAAGMTLSVLRNAIVARLSKLVVASDVAVNRVGERGQMVTVQGNLTKPGMYPITQTAQRLSSALALAAPVQENPEQMVITLRRDNQLASVRLADIYRNQDNDILLRAGDVITASDAREHLTVLGAAGNQGRVVISKRNYTVLDALADARGLDGATADPRSVFLFTPAQAGVDGKPDSVPVVYQFDLTKPEQVAMARQFAVREGEAIYISDAPFAQVQKVLSAFRFSMSAGFSATRQIDGGSGPTNSVIPE